MYWWDKEVPDIVAFTIIGACIALCGYLVYVLWWLELGQPTSDYCKYRDPIIYVNQTVLTNNDRCFNYLLDLDYDLIGKNGSYYILEPKN